MQKFALGKNPLRLLPVLPVPTARAGPEGLHSQPVLHNAHRPISLAMMLRWISLVPPPTIACLASRKYRSMSYSGSCA